MIAGALMQRAFIKGIKKRLGEEKTISTFKHIHRASSMNLILEIAGFLSQREYKNFAELNDWKALRNYRIAFLTLFFIHIFMLSLIFVVPLYLEFRTLGIIASIPLIVIIALASKLYLNGKIRL